MVFVPMHSPEYLCYVYTNALPTWRWQIITYIFLATLLYVVFLCRKTRVFITDVFINLSVFLGKLTHVSISIFRSSYKRRFNCFNKQMDRRYHCHFFSKNKLKTKLKNKHEMKV